jgi:hypothetical protein
LSARTCCRSGDDLAHVLLDDVGILAQRGIHVAEDHTEPGEVFTVAVEDDFALVLRGYAREVLALGLGMPSFS